MFRYILLLCLAANSFGLQSQPDASNLLTYDADLNDPQVMFEQTTDPTQQISGLHLHFLTGDDCYSGWTGMYSTEHGQSFIVHPNMKFGFDAKLVYQAMLNSISDQPASSIHSMLVRFIRPWSIVSYDRFARFLGSCQDQEINCCVPVQCSDNSAKCVVMYKIDTQEISWTTAKKNW